MTSSHIFPKKMIAGLLGIFISTSALSADIAHKIRNNNQDNTTTENYFELGLGLGIGIAPSLTDDDDYNFYPDVISVTELTSHKKINNPKRSNSTIHDFI